MKNENVSIDKRLSALEQALSKQSDMNRKMLREFMKSIKGMLADKNKNFDFERFVEAINSSNRKDINKLIKSISSQPKIIVTNTSPRIVPYVS